MNGGRWLQISNPSENLCSNPGRGNNEISAVAVLLGVDGISDFDGLVSPQHDEEVHYAFDILALESEDLRKLPLHLRILARRSNGIFASDFEQGAIDPEPFRKACERELFRSTVTAPYRTGTAQHRVKVRIPGHEHSQRSEPLNARTFLSEQ